MLPHAEPRRGCDNRGGCRREPARHPFGAGLSHPSGATGRSPAGEGWAPKVLPPALLLERDHGQEVPRAEPARWAGRVGVPVGSCSPASPGAGFAVRDGSVPASVPLRGAACPEEFERKERAIAYSRSLGPAGPPGTGSSRSHGGAGDRESTATREGSPGSQGKLKAEPAGGTASVCGTGEPAFASNSLRQLKRDTEILERSRERGRGMPWGRGEPGKPGAVGPRGVSKGRLRTF